MIHHNLHHERKKKSHTFDDLILSISLKLINFNVCKERKKKESLKNLARAETIRVGEEEGSLRECSNSRETWWTDIDTISADRERYTRNDDCTSWTVAIGWRTVARALARASNEPASPPYRRVSNTQTGTRTGFTYKRGDVNISVDLQTAARQTTQIDYHTGPTTCPPCQWQASRADKSLGTVKSKQMKSLG